MKKFYETPAVEKIAFQYRDQVVVASGGINTSSCTINYSHSDSESTNCTSQYDWVSSTGPEI